MRAAMMGGPARHVLMTTDAVGGVWTYAVDLVEGFAERGISTTLAVLGPRPSVDQRQQVAAIPGLTLVETDLPLDWLADAPNALAPAADRLRALAEDSGADLIHLNTPTLAAGQTFDQPVISVAHSCLATWWSAVRDQPMPDDFRWRCQRHWQGLLASDAIIAPSSAFAEDTARTYETPRPFVVHNGRRDAAPQAAPKQRLVCTAGRLWDDGKNVAVLDAAARWIDAPLLAAGPLDGPTGERRRLVHAQARGPMSTAAIRRTFAEAQVFASAALYEPFGLAVLEAAQAGCALVLSDIPTFRELWDGAALFAPARDPKALAQAIQRLLDDPEARQRLAGAATERARRYSVAAMVEGVLGVYRALWTGTGAIADQEAAA
ncbi:glycosyltransferase family 4 protein [Caulobacter sp. LARHSG274]